MQNDFDMKHVEMLLKYKTYLLYDLEIKLESAEAFIAINYFLGKLTGKVPCKLFRTVEAHVSEDWIDSYNEFIKHYLEKGFKRNNIITSIEDSYEEETVTEIEDEKQTLDYFDYETCPEYNTYPCKIVETLDTNSYEFTVEHLYNTNCLFYTILVSPKTLKMMYQKGYKLNKKQVVLTQNIDLYVNDGLPKDTYKYFIYLAQQLHQIKKVKFEGPASNLEVVFSGIKVLLLSELYQKIMFKYERDISKEIVSDDDIEFIPDFKEDIKDNDYTEIKLPKVKL